MTEHHTDDPNNRLRARPDERFAGNSRVFDLDASVRDLRAEAPPTQRGHRQITLFKQLAVTQVLFAFDAGSALTNHVAHGLVTIHVLEGQLSVQADGQEHALRAGHILMLNPGVAHDVRAAEPSAMLLTVHLDDKA